MIFDIALVVGLGVSFTAGYALASSWARSKHADIWNDGFYHGRSKAYFPTDNPYLDDKE